MSVNDRTDGNGVSEAHDRVETALKSTVLGASFLIKMAEGWTGRANWSVNREVNATTAGED